MFGSQSHTSYRRDFDPSLFSVKLKIIKNTESLFKTTVYVFIPPPLYKLYKYWDSGKAFKVVKVLDY